MGDVPLPYNYLVLATGAHENYSGHPEWRLYAPGLKSVVDATSIRRKILLSFETAEMETDPEKIEELLTFVLVGAGPTGVEMAGALSDPVHNPLATDFSHVNTKSPRLIFFLAFAQTLECI